VQNHAADKLHIEMPHLHRAQPASRTTAKASGKISSSAAFSAAFSSSSSVIPSSRAAILAGTRPSSPAALHP